MVSSSDNLDIVEVVRVDGWEADTAIVHLSGENFVSVEVVSEKTAIRVGQIMGISSSYIWESSKKSMH
jgi:hypothetical protein